MRDLTLAATGLAAAPALLAACGQAADEGTRTRAEATLDPEERWEVPGASTLQEVLVTTGTDAGGRLLSLYDASFDLLRQGDLGEDAWPAVGGQVRLPALSLPYVRHFGGDDRSERTVLRLVNLESGRDEVLLAGEAGRGITDITLDPVTGRCYFAYTTTRWAEASPRELWQASVGSAERIDFEQAFREVMTEDDELRVPPKPLTADVRPVAVHPDGRRLFFTRHRAYCLDLLNRGVERFSDYDFVHDLAISPDGARAAVGFQVLDEVRFGLAIIDLVTGSQIEVSLPGPYEPRGPIWHPDSRRLACWGSGQIRGPDGVALPSVFSRAFLLDSDTGSATQLPENPATPPLPSSLPPDIFERPTDYLDDYIDHTWTHSPVGFTADGRTLLVAESRMALAAHTPTSATTSAADGQEAEETPATTPRAVVTAPTIVAIDVETTARGDTLDEFPRLLITRAVPPA